MEGPDTDMTKKKRIENQKKRRLYIISLNRWRSIMALAACAVTILTGPSVPLCPELFNFGLDRIAGITELKNWFIIRLWALLYTICLAILLMFAAAMTVFWRNVRTFLLHMRPKGVPLYLYSTAMRTVYVIFLMTLGISLMYRWFPHKKLKFSEQLPGAFVATIGWMAFSLFVTVYLGAFHAFSTYGSLTTLAIVMFWLYFSMYIIMIGAEVNEVMRQDRENKDS